MQFILWCAVKDHYRPRDRTARSIMQSRHELSDDSSSSSRSFIHLLRDIQVDFRIEWKGNEKRWGRRVLVRIQNQVHRKWVSHEGKGRQGKEEPNSFIRKSEIRRRERLFRERVRWKGRDREEITSRQWMRQWIKREKIFRLTISVSTGNSRKERERNRQRHIQRHSCFIDWCVLFLASCLLHLGQGIDTTELLKR